MKMLCFAISVCFAKGFRSLGIRVALRYVVMDCEGIGYGCDLCMSRGMWLCMCFRT